MKADLYKMIGSQQVNILALVHKRYTFFEGLFHTSISKQMADGAKIPLLVLPCSFSMDVADLANDELDRFCYETGDTR